MIFFRTLIFTSLFCLNLKAEGTYDIEASHIEIRYKTSYEGIFTKDKKGENYAIFILRKGENTSQYFNYITLRNDSLHFVPGGFELLRKEDKERDIHPEKYPPKAYMPAGREYIYKNLSNGEITSYRSTMGERFKYTDTPIFDWKLVTDSTKNIIGHDCQLAETDFRGRHWKVWFALDIPIPIGPWKFGGLPGLILQAECPGFLNIKGFEILTKNLPPIKYYNYFKKKNIDIDRKKFLNMCTNPNNYPKGTSLTPEMELE